MSTATIPRRLRRQGLRQADFSLENRFGALEGVRVAGVDEVGRGALAGPVVAAAVSFRHHRLGPVLRRLIRDSKTLAVHQREQVMACLADYADYAVASAGLAEIETLNVLGASLLAMKRAVAALTPPPATVLVDGDRLPELDCVACGVPGGDASSLSIAAASIVAKVTRDRLMTELAGHYPGYGWERNRGYATAAHLEALALHGPTAQHRRNFGPIRPAIAEEGAGGL